MPEHPHVELGVLPDGAPAHSLPAYPQTWSRIVNKLGRLYDKVRREGGELDTEEISAATLLGFVGGNAYEALCIFIPNLPERMPEYEFAGYGSRDAFEARDYDEREDQAPTFPQLIEAFECCLEVNGGKRLTGMLGQVFDPKLLRAEASLALSEWRESQLTGSPSSLSTSDGSTPPSSSGTSDRISDELVSAGESENGSAIEASSGSRQAVSV